MSTVEEREFAEEEIDAQLALVEEKLAGRKLDLYKPHPKQELFHRMGGDVAISDRLLMAGKFLFNEGELRVDFFFGEFAFFDGRH